jgi:restriction system protein
MAIPDFQKIMLPFLEHIKDGKEYKLQEISNLLAIYLKLTKEELDEKIKQGTSRFDSRVHWVKTYFKQSKLIDTPRRGVFKINQRGLNVLKSKPDRIDIKFLMQFKEFQDFKSRKGTLKNNKKHKEESLDILGEKINGETPQELIETGVEELNNKLKGEIYEYIMKNDFYFFEKLVVDLLSKMGYGNELQEKEVTKKSGDEGIDGIIKEDKLGLDYIYIQAKRWNGSVGRPEVQKFVGALTGKKAKKGVFFTTSDYSKGAYEYASTVEHSIILINKEKLLDLIIEYNVGVQLTHAYELKKIDIDYFEDDY